MVGIGLLGVYFLLFELSRTFSTMTLVQNKNILESLYQHLDGYHTAHEITNTILESSLETIEKNYYSNRIAEYVSNWGEGQILEVVRVCFDISITIENGFVTLFLNAFILNKLNENGINLLKYIIK